MKGTTLFAVLALTLFGCGNEDMPLDTDSTVAAITETDYFHCFEAGNCSAPALSNSKLCLRGRDYDVSLQEQVGDVVVLSFHGGLIEPHSTELAAALALKFGWSRYDLSAHGTAACLGGTSNYSRLHITATDFDDPVAVSLVGGHKKAVAIHGYSSSRGNGRGTLCVGGANAGQVQAFLSAVNQHRASFPLYALQPVDAASGKSPSGADCSGLTGTAHTNIVNRVAGNTGGLQLEMSDGIKADLLNPAPQYDALRTVFYSAVSAAMSK